MTLTLDRKRSRNPVKTQRIEQRYALQLRKVAQQVGSIVAPFTPGDMSSVPTIEQLLKAYSDMLKGWATQTASNMLMDVALRDEQAWQTMAKELSRGLREEIRNAPTGRVMQQLLAEQVTLIQSIPLEAAQRVHRLTLEGIENSTRASEIAARDPAHRRGDNLPRCADCPHRQPARQPRSRRLERNHRRRLVHLAHER
jgi:hypothetical protein